MYITVECVKRQLQEDLYDDTNIDTVIEDTNSDVEAWINSACRRPTGFSESDLVGADALIRLASCCFCACRVMSEQLEGHNIDQESLAVFRCDEARQHVRMWCSNNGGIIPSFDDIFVPSPGTDITPEVGTSFAHAAGTDAVTIGTTN